MGGQADARASKREHRRDSLGDVPPPDEVTRLGEDPLECGGGGAGFRVLEHDGYILVVKGNNPYAPHYH